MPFHERAGPSSGGFSALKQFGTFVLDTANECLWSGNSQIALQPKPFAVLRYLTENPGRLITHDELLDKIWPDTFVQPQVLRTYVLELRKILGDDAAQPQFIQTLPKRGYCFVAPVAEKAISTRGSSPPAAGPAGLLDREAEIARLNDHLLAVKAGQRRMIFVSGEPGIGKTALLDSFVRESEGEILIARGHCVPGVCHEESFYPVSEALGHLGTSGDRESVCRVLARVAPAWLAAFGREQCAELKITYTPGERSPGSLCAALEEISAARPLLLVIEDLQWADGATLKLLAALARRRTAAQLMIVGTYRPRSVSGDHLLKTLRQELVMQRLADELAVSPLGKPFIFELLSREIGHGELPSQVCSFVHERADGNPAFALAILRNLIAQGLLTSRGKNGETQWLAAEDLETSAGVPDELAQMVELEFERLSEHDQRLLEAASLMPIAFPAWAVAAALEEDPVDTEEACELLARRCSFVQRAGSDELPDGSTTGFYAFTHRLYRDVLYQRQTPTRRARRHIRVAQKLAQLFAGREALVAREMAMHYEAAGDWRLSADALRVAAEYASKRGSHSEAAELLEKALRAVEDHSEAGEATLAIRKALEVSRKHKKSGPESLTFS
jgi:predicted ATPase